MLSLIKIVIPRPEQRSRESQTIPLSCFSFDKHYTSSSGAVLLSWKSVVVSKTYTRVQVDI